MRSLQSSQTLRSSQILIDLCYEESFPQRGRNFPDAFEFPMPKLPNQSVNHGFKREYIWSQCTSRTIFSTANLFILITFCLVLFP